MRLTIITPTLNRRDLLAQALDSVTAQGVAVEHIVVDGGSTDGTLDLLAAHPQVQVVTDRRRGLYDAINLGLAAATGDVIGLLNSDDLYAPGAFEASLAGLAADPAAESVCGHAELFDASGPLARYDDERDLALDAHAALIGACIPNARFFRRAVFDRVGLFSTAYPHVADREFLARALAAGMRTMPVPALVYRYRSHPGSLTFAAGATRAGAIRRELLALSRAVQAQADATPALVAKARALEGRCLGILAADQLRAGRAVGAARLMGTRDGTPSLRPLAALLAALADRASPRRGNR